MATITRYVNTASTPGGDGTTNATSGADRAYASLNEWEASEQTNLDTANNIMDCICEGSVADTVAVTISGWTTSAVDYIQIRTTQTNRHDGKWNTSKYRLVTSPAGSGVMVVESRYVNIDGLQIYHDGGSPSTEASAILFKGVDLRTKIIIKNSILRGGRYTFRNGNSSVKYIDGQNNMIYGGSTGAVVQIVDGGIIKQSNCTCIGVSYGVYAFGGWIQSVNCYATGSIAAYINVLLLTSASADSTGSAGLQNISYSTDNFVNVTGGSEDLHLVVGSALKDVGTDLYDPLTQPHFDVSSVVSYRADVVTGTIVEFTNSSKIVTVKYRDFEGSAWITELEKSFELQFSFTGTSFKAAIISDTHIGSSIGGESAIVELTTAIDDIDDNLGDIDYVYLLGDIVNDGTNLQYDDYITEKAKSDISGSNWYELTGNHDNPINFKSKLGYAEVYYSIILGNVDFIFLGDEGSHSISGTAQTWFEDELINNQDKNIFILQHQGLYNTTISTLLSDGFLEPKTTLLAYLTDNNWDALFCGHSHGYVLPETLPPPGEQDYYNGYPNNFDIDGETRSGTWDIGADEFVTVGGIVIPVFGHYYRQQRAC